MLWLAGIAVALFLLALWNVLYGDGGMVPGPYDEPSNNAYIWAEIQKLKNEQTNSLDLVTGYNNTYIGPHAGNPLIEVDIEKVVDKPKRIKYAKKVNPIEGRKFREINSDPSNHQGR